MTNVLTTEPSITVEIPWTEKYRPALLSQLKREKAVETMISWAKKWANGEQVKKGLIIYGAPGTGKTSSAIALAKEMDWEYVEFNASDIRSKDAIEQNAIKGSFYSSISDQKNRKKLIVMDEVDSLYERNVEGSDAGGKAAISSLLEKTLNPVILIANDYYALRSSSTGKAIADRCEQVEFRRYMKSQIITVLKEILQSEGIYAPPERVNEIAENANGDMRAAVNDLQGIGEVYETEARDLTLSAYSVINDILHGHQKNIRATKAEIMNIGMDPNDFILYLLENVFPLHSRVDDFSLALSNIGRADLFLGRVGKRMNYSLWSYANDFMSYISMLQLKSERFEKFSFPSLIKNMASLRKYRGIRKDFSMIMGRYVHKSSSFMNRDSLPYFYYLLQRDEELRKNIEERTGLDTEDIFSLDF
ncbi:MAG: replication factor C large subunit [Thermoplasmatales archaeon]|jgi:replication factor C large subunit|nr:replication factor C large subunit [Candidatus Thermoplasmatota archaeon]MCL6002816.1 replication factor C large subunit [Candidatus Thermoplasmatota archaeon]MDA8056056.1 replication factor C large subunit [Thermoplasmatales archaeon]